MRIIIYGLSLIITVAFLGGVALFWWGSQQYKQPGPLQKEIIIIIPRGANVGGVADILSYESIISEPLLFKIAARLSGQAGAIKAGEYEFTPELSMEEILQKLVEGEVYQRRFTMAEGLTSWQIVQLLNKEEALSGEIAAIPAEGSLLPETYNYLRGDKRADKIKRMQSGMTKALDELWPQRADNLSIKTKEETLILASIVEKETAVASERKRVAGVFINRLRKGIALQTDPTVIYALTGGKIEENGMGPLGRRLLKKDLEIDSPYNTYKYPGLPPGPIANPGRESLAAVLNPEKHDFIYFVADGSGGHAFAKTLEEHNRNVAKWRKIRKAQ